MKSNKTTSEHYQWGDNCDGWHLLKTDSLSVIEERMPPGTEEIQHFHHKAQQFFYILSGIATFEWEDQVETISTSEGIHIPPMTKHKIRNNSSDELHFLVISQPKAHGDRINCEL